MAQPSTPKTRRHIGPIVVFATIAVGLAVLFRDSLSFDSLAENRGALLAYRDAHFGLSVALFMAIYAGIVAFSLPGATIATLTGGFLFATFPGAVFNIVAATSGACLLFLAARWGLGDWLSTKMETGSPRVQRIKRGLDDNQWSMLFLMRLAPVVPFFVANLLPALLGASFHRFAISTAIGIIPGAVIYTSVGAGLGKVFETGASPDLGLIFEPHILLPILGLCALAILPIFLNSRTKQDL